MTVVAPSVAQRSVVETGSTLRFAIVIPVPRAAEMESRLRGNDDWGLVDGTSLGAGGWHLEHLSQLACAESSVGNGSNFAGMTVVVEAGFLFGFWAVSCVMGSENAGLFAGG